jgi:hypothetical protein
MSERKSATETKTHQYDPEWALQRLQLVARDLEKVGVFLVHGSELEDSGGRWIDNAWDDAEAALHKRAVVAARTKDKPGDSLVLMNRVSFLFYPPWALSDAAIKGKMFLQHNIRAEDRDQIEHLFRTHFSSQSLGFPKSDEECLRITLPPRTAHQTSHTSTKSSKSTKSAKSAHYPAH